MQLYKGTGVGARWIFFFFSENYPTFLLFQFGIKIHVIFSDFMNISAKPQNPNKTRNHIVLF